MAPISFGSSRSTNPTSRRASLGDNGEPHLTRLQIKNRVCGIPLRKDDVLLRKEHSFPALANGGEERVGVERAKTLITKEILWNQSGVPIKTLTPAGG
jgi:hypothetical protein